MTRTEKGWPIAWVKKSKARAGQMAKAFFYRNGEKPNINLRRF